MRSICGSVKTHNRFPILQAFHVPASSMHWVSHVFVYPSLQLYKLYNSESRSHAGTKKWSPWELVCTFMVSESNLWIIDSVMKCATIRSTSPDSFPDSRFFTHLLADLSRSSLDFRVGWICYFRKSIENPWTHEVLNTGDPGNSSILHPILWGFPAISHQAGHCTVTMEVKAQ